MGITTVQSKVNFDQAFDRIIGHEGGYVNNPNDPGGETNWGISKRSYPNVDIKMLTREGVKAIYKRDFWDAANVGSLPPSIIFQLFDFAINSGIQTAIRYMQKTVGAADDGHWGPMSQGKADAMAESDMLMLLIANRQDFMTNLKGWQDFGKGWIRRMSSNLRYAAQDNEV